MNPGPAPQFDRQEVLCKAMELFWEQGYEATGMAQLVEHVGIGRQSLYNTFRDKHSLFLEALEAYEREFLQRFIEVLEGPGSPLDNVRQVFRMWEQMAQSGELKGCLYASASASLGRHDPVVAKALEAAYERLEGVLTRAFERAREAGELGPEVEPRDLARLFINTGQGLAVLSSVRGLEFVRGVLRSFEALLGRGA
jgi:TetR/AcrR family transcriptional repressor of nem operon